MNERKGTLVDDLNDFDGFFASMKSGNIIVITGDAQSGKTKLAMKVAHALRRMWNRRTESLPRSLRRRQADLLHDEDVRWYKP